MTVMKVDPEETGKKLKELRGERSQEEVGKAVGCSAMAISQYETGKRTPVDTMKVKLANYFHVGVEYLFYTQEVNR